MREGIFPTFFLSGFECSTFDWLDKGRRDAAAETQHRLHAAEDYALLHDLGIAAGAKRCRGHSSRLRPATTFRSSIP